MYILCMYMYVKSYQFCCNMCLTAGFHLVNFSLWQWFEDNSKTEPEVHSGFQQRAIATSVRLVPTSGYFKICLLYTYDILPWFLFFLAFVSERKTTIVFLHSKTNKKITFVLCSLNVYPCITRSLHIPDFKAQLYRLNLAFCCQIKNN